MYMTKWILDQRFGHNRWNHHEIGHQAQVRFRRDRKRRHNGRDKRYHLARDAMRRVWPYQRGM